MTTDLATFAKDVQAVAALVPAAGRFGGKVWIHAVWAAGRFDCNLRTFKAMLIQANTARVLDLSRCDLVEAFDAYDVRRSVVETADGARFHFVRLA